MDTVKRWMRGAGVGCVATLADMAALALLVEGMALAPTVANVPALLVGAIVQFLGCRYLVFRAAQGDLSRQMAGFAATEAATLVLNGLIFHFLVAVTAMPYVIARPLGTFLVFVGFSFPLWARVFRSPRATAG